MAEVFLQILNLSLAGSYVILVVLALRLLLKKAPKIFSYALWSVVFFRLLCPFTFESTWSLMPIRNDAVSTQIAYEQVPTINSGIESLDNIVNQSLPEATPVASINPIQIWILVGEIIWCLGVLVMVGQCLVAVFKLKKRLNNATLVERNIYESKYIETAFVLGIVKPKIYLPHKLEQEERQYIIKHEEIHARRFDPLFKFIAFVAVCIHWFNPLVWWAFKLMSKDMELSCDEQVIKELGYGIKKNYSASLVAVATKTSKIKYHALAFGENDTKSRVKNILAYKKPTIWIVVISVILVSGSIFGLLGQHKDGENSYLDPEVIYEKLKKKDSIAEVKVLDNRVSGYTYLDGGEIIRWLRRTTWQAKDVSSAYELSATYVIEGLLGNNIRSQIELYESEPTLVKVIYQDKWRYYTIKQSDYEKIEFMIMNKSYFEPTDGEEELVSTSETINTSETVIDETEIGEAVSTTQLLDEYFNTLMAADIDSSDPLDYVKANQATFDKIISYDEAALIYCFNQFEKGEGAGLKGQLMMLVCRSIAGEADNDLAYATGQEWYETFKSNAFKLKESMEEEYFEKNMPKSYLLVQFIEGNLEGRTEEILLPDYTYVGDDPILKLVYETQLGQYVRNEGFSVFAAHIFGSYEEEDKLKVFATINDSTYRLDGKEVYQISGSVVPVAITYVKNVAGDYVLETYKMAMDGSFFKSSIEEFCTMPVSGKEIKGLSKRMLNHYGAYDDLTELEINNLREHLLRYGQSGVTLVSQYNDTQRPLT